MRPPGPVHAIAYNVILIGGVSTVLSMAIRCLRFDGYYVLADAIELPNLGQRANRYLGYLVQRYAFGSRDVSFPPTDGRAKAWFVFYGIAPLPTAFSFPSRSSSRLDRASSSSACFWPSGPVLLR
jgi:hypothetical protein